MFEKNDKVQDRYKGDFKIAIKIEPIDAATSDKVLWTFWATQNTMAS